MKRMFGIAGGSLTLALVAQILATGPASADDTTVDVEVTQGSLTISSQPASTTLTGARFSETEPSTAEGSFGSITVTDGRGLTSVGWTLTASSTDFTGLSDPGQSIVLSATSPFTFEATTVTVGPDPTSGVGTAAGGALTSAGTGVAIATGTNAVGLGDITYTWNPDVSLVVPANTPAQTYRGTVTLTVA